MSGRGVFDRLRNQKRSSPEVPEVIDVDAELDGADGAPAHKHARSSERDEDAAASNKFSGDEVLRRVATTAQGGALRPAAVASFTPAAFYGAASAVVSAVRGGVSAWKGAGAAKAPVAPPAEHNVAGSSRLVPLQIDDDDDDEQLAKGRAASAAHEVEARLLGPPRAAPCAEPVVVESSRAWIGIRGVQKCRLTFTSDRVSLWARFLDGTDLYYSDLLCEGVVTKLLSAYNACDESTWPPDFCAVLALETSSWPSGDIVDIFDPHSSDPQWRALCTLFLDNLEWTDKQREILSHNCWGKRWRRLKIEDQDALMVGRRTSAVAGAKRSAKLRARDRRSAAPQLQAPLVYPPENIDSVTVTNADLLRLEVSEFLNDSLVDFALKRLQEQLAQQLTPTQYERKFHFFNCFFFKKLLTDEPAMRWPGYADEAHARVRKWTTHVDLFSKDFVVVPINQSLHWSLIIMCNLGKAEQLLDERRVTDVDADVIDVDAEPAESTGATPVILHLNSMSGTHANVENVLREYLAREWAARRGQTLKRGEALFGKAGPVVFCRASVPQQDNFYDCGIFLIEFARRFCLNTPQPYLSMRAADGWPYMLRSSWFLPTDAGESNRDALRAEILSLGECAKTEKAAGAGPSSARAAAPVVSLVDSDDEDAPIAGLLVRPERDTAAAAARSPPPSSPPLLVSEDVD